MNDLIFLCVNSIDIFGICSSIILSVMIVYVLVKYLRKMNVSIQELTNFKSDYFIYFALIIDEYGNCDF